MPQVFLDILYRNKHMFLLTLYPYQYFLTLLSLHNVIFYKFEKMSSQSGPMFTQVFFVDLVSSPITPILREVDHPQHIHGPFYINMPRVSNSQHFGQ
jgi:hypothetical protein